MEPTKIELRPYQETALTRWFKAWESRAGTKLPQRVKRPVVHMATGGGKTVLFVEGIKRYLQANPNHRVMLIAHTRELIYQMHGAFFDVWHDVPNTGINNRPFIGIEMADQKASNAQIIVTTRQTIVNRLDEVLRYGKIDVLIIDEVHHFSPDNSYQTILDKLQDSNNDLKVVGFTATPERGDGKALLAEFDEIVFRWTITDGIDDGYLVPPHRVIYGVDVDISNVSQTTEDYRIEDLTRILEASGWVEHTVKAYIDMVHKKRDKCLVFMPSVEMGKEVSEILGKMGVNVRYIDANTDKKERAKSLSEFSDGDVEAVVNVMVLTEGVNIPCVNAILNARPTKNLSLYTQIVGRALRTHPVSGKKDALIVDLSASGGVSLFGDLMGKVKTCDVCGSTYYYGKKKCPNCQSELIKTKGKEKEEEKSQGGADRRKKLFSTIIGKREKKLFSKTDIAWFYDRLGYMSAPIGERGGAFIAPPTKADVSAAFEELNIVSSSGGFESPKAVSLDLLISRALKYTLFFYHPDSGPILVGHREDLEPLFHAADKKANEFGGFLTQKNGSWRSKPISGAQLNLLNKRPDLVKRSGLTLDMLPNLTKGEAASLITHIILYGQFYSYLKNQYSALPGSVSPF